MSKQYRDKGTRAARPQQASTLIIVRAAAGKARVLMGKRSAQHKFMPNKFVFPGGRMDAIDSRLKVPHDLRAPILRRLQSETPKHMNEAKLRGLALAAVRETFEETGLVVGHRTNTPLRTRHSGWQDYFNHGATPPLDRIDYIGRAITPTYRTRRYDTRFFMLHDDVILTDPEDTQNASGELLHLHWLTIRQARELDLPAITRQMLDIVEARLKLPRARQFHAAAPFVRFKHNKPIITPLK